MNIEIFNSHALLDTDDDELFGKLRAYFSITDKLFNPRAGHYDSTECFILPDGTIPLGLLPDAIEYLQELEIEYDIADYRRNIAVFDKAKLTNPVKSFGSMREHQAEALLAYAERLTTTDFKESAIFDHATNSGKSYIIAALLDALEEGYAFILVHDATLYTQLIDFLKKAGFTVGSIRGKQIIPGQVIVCMYQSVINRHHEFEPTLVWLVNEATLLIVDECHRAGGNEYYLLINSLGVATRIGFSGTPFSSKHNAAKIRVMSSFGDIVHKVSTQRLNEAGINATLHVNLLYHSAPIITGSKTDMEYAEVYAANIIESPARLKLIMEAVGKHTEGNIMITVNQLVHTMKIGEAVMQAYPEAEVIMLNGGQPEYMIRELLAKFSTKPEGRRVLITNIWQEGANIAMDVLIYAQAGSSEIELVQYLGRMGRLTSANKYVYDFYDDGKYCEKQSKERIAIYQRYGYKITAQYATKIGSLEPSLATIYKNDKLSLDIPKI